MKFTQLRHFLAVVETGTIRHAARQLNLSQSSVTKSIQQLELSLQTPLFDRTGQGLTPTAAGQALIARAKTIEAEMRHARNDIDAIRGATGGAIRLAASPSVSLGLLPHALGTFVSRHRGVRIHIEEGVYPDVLPAIRMGELDFAVTLVPERPHDDDLMFTLLLRDTLVPVVRADHPLTRQGAQALADLVGFGWVIYRRGGSGRDVFERSFTANGLDAPVNIIECTSFAASMAIVENTDYLTLAPTQHFAARSTRLPVRPLFLKAPMQPWDVTLIRRTGHTLSPVCEAFLAELQRTAERAQASAL